MLWYTRRYKHMSKEDWKEYSKTFYTRILRKQFWPSNMISATPVRFKGIYLWTIYKFAKPTYKWTKL